MDTAYSFSSSSWLRAIAFAKLFNTDLEFGLLGGFNWETWGANSIDCETGAGVGLAVGSLF